MEKSKKKKLLKKRKEAVVRPHRGERELLVKLLL